MTASALNAAEKTSMRGWRIAISAATRKVLSPISEKTIMVSERKNESEGWIISLPGCFDGILVSGEREDPGFVERSGPRDLSDFPEETE